MARCSSKNSDFSSVLETSWSRSESERTRSTTRPSRVDVERIIVPLAEIKTAGVIMAVKTASDEVSPSMKEGSRTFYNHSPRKEQFVKILHRKQRAMFHPL